MATAETKVRARLGAIEIDNTGLRSGEAAVGDTVPIVFLHGFGGMAAQWRPLQTRLSHDMQTLAFDLPGHGTSLDYPGFGPPKLAAEAVLNELDARTIEKAVIVGHSMGGAVASLMALLAPGRVQALVLLAPGGFGETFNHDLLMEWAQAASKEALGTVMPRFFGPGFEVPEKAVTLQYQARQEPRLVEALVKIGASMARDGKQGVLPLAALAQCGVPMQVLWGTQDGVLPVEQAKALEAPFEVTLLDGVGHSPAEEAPEATEQAIRKAAGL
ncbi:MAG: alpha/beta fold hydrolase [Pseudomonadota bacterium]